MSTHLESGSVTRTVSDHAADLTPERIMDRHHWSQHISRLDPATDYHEIYRILGALFQPRYLATSSR